MRGCKRIDTGFQLGFTRKAVVKGGGRVRWASIGSGRSALPILTPPPAWTTEPAIESVLQNPRDVGDTGFHGGGSWPVSALDAFYAAWANARRTFGERASMGGRQFDASARLRQLGHDVGCAAPGPVWSGDAAMTYGARNAKHRAVLHNVADLDQRLGRSVEQSAQVITGARQNLDSLRRWVTGVADTVPPGTQREAQLTQIASKGLERLSNVVGGANNDLNGVARNIDTITSGYNAVNLKEAPNFGDVSNVEEASHFKEAPAFGDDKTDMSSGDINEVDRTNRELLQEMSEEYGRLPDSQIKTDRLADIAGIQEGLKVPDSHLVYLEKPGDPSQMIPAATSVGDPFTADHVSVTVPGVGSTTRGTIAGMTGEAAELRNEALSAAKAASAPDRPISTNIAAVAWVGYQPPANLGQTSILNDDLAQAGAPKLTSLLSDLDSASRNPGQTTALFGHSYGSLTAGIALNDGASHYVDNAVLYGSPGFQADTPADLGMNDNNFFVMSTFDDPINPLGAFAPYHGWGSDPNNIISDDSLRFRFQHLETAAGDTPIPGYESKTGASGHSDYSRNAGERMTGYNLAAILLNRPDLAVTQTPNSWR